MLFIWNSGHVVEKKMETLIRGLLHEGERPDIVILDIPELERVKREDGLFSWIGGEVLQSLKTPSIHKILIEKETKVVRLREEIPPPKYPSAIV